MPVHPLQQHPIGVSLHLHDNIASRVEGQMHMRVNKTGQQRDIAKINYGQVGRDAVASQINLADPVPGHNDQRRAGMEGLTIEQASRTQPPPATVGDLRPVLIHRLTSGVGGPPDMPGSCAREPLMLAVPLWSTPLPAMLVQAAATASCHRSSLSVSVPPPCPSSPGGLAERWRLAAYAWKAICSRYAVVVAASWSSVMSGAGLAGGTFLRSVGHNHLSMARKPSRFSTMRRLRRSALRRK